MGSPPKSSSRDAREAETRVDVSRRVEACALRSCGDQLPQLFRRLFTSLVRYPACSFSAASGVADLPPSLPDGYSSGVLPQAVLRIVAWLERQRGRMIRLGSVYER